MVSLATISWHVRKSWKDKAERKDNEISTLAHAIKQKDKEISALEVKVRTAEDTNKKLLEEQEKEGAEKDKELSFLRQELSSRAKRRDEQAQRIRSYLDRQGSPMAPTAEELVRISDSHQIDPFLLVGIAGVESAFGKRCYGFNPFGYLKGGGGVVLRRYSSWVDGYEAICKFIRSHWGRRGQKIESAYQLRGYCVPDHPWMEKVEAVRRKL